MKKGGRGSGRRCLRKNSQGGEMLFQERRGDREKIPKKTKALQEAQMSQRGGGTTVPLKETGPLDGY